MFYKVGFFLLLGIAVFIAGMQAPKFFQTPSPAPSPTPYMMEEASTSPTLAVSPTATPASDIESIRKAMAERHGKVLSDVELEVSKKTTVHAWGSTRFKGEISGAWFLAYKESTGWIIVDDGNGTISCETITPYNFPASMVPECINASGKLIVR